MSVDLTFVVTSCRKYWELSKESFVLRYLFHRGKYELIVIFSLPQRLLQQDEPSQNGYLNELKTKIKKSTYN